jgi:hypothetical protein
MQLKRCGLLWRMTSTSNLTEMLVGLDPVLPNHGWFGGCNIVDLSSRRRISTSQPKRKYTP